MQFLLGLLNPQLGIGALLVGSGTFLLWRYHRDRSVMDPELARVRVMEKVVNRALPWWKRGTADSVADCVKVLGALTAPDSSRGPSGDDSSAQPPPSADGVEANEPVEPDDSDGP